MCFNLPHPVPNVVEGRLIGHVIRQDNTHGAFVVSLGDRSETFLASCVPDLKLDLFPVHLHCLNFEINSDSCQVRCSEVPFRELEKDACFPYSRITDN
jgi:hypothetical protein